MIRIGTDCSGIEAPIQALKNMNIDFRHIFSSDIDKFCIKSIKENYSPEILYEQDIRTRKVEDIPDIDLYVCGFPCQPFSNAGRKKGFKDNRGNVFFECIKVIKHKKPSFFILENVKGILKKDIWDVIYTELKTLENIYNIVWKVLNTKDYGIPQNRERLYIVGKIKDKGIFQFPEHCEMDNIENYIDHNDNTYKTTSKRHEQILSRLQGNNKVFIDFAYGVSTTRSFKNADRLCPCITVKNSIWCVPKHRYININELLALQGFKNFKQCVSDFQTKKQIGNSMSVPVIQKIIENLISIV
jgi:DNA (cytosine-5)-methyltransferase 1